MTYRILVTGGAGFIGSRFIHWLRQNVDCEIMAIDDLSGGFEENLPSDVPLFEVTLGGNYAPPGQSARSLVRKFEPHYVYHFAAFAAEGLSPFVREYTVKNTWLATTEIINACINAGCVKRLVFTSSMAVYGNQQPPFDEQLQRKPIDPYGVGKAACEMDIEIAGEQHGLDYCVIRPHNVYGSQQNIWGDYRNVLGIWMRQILEDKSIRVYGDGSQSRAFSYIDDCLPCLWRAAVDSEASRQIINLGGTRPITILEAAECLSAIVGGVEIEHTEPRHEVRQAWSTWAKSVELLGYEDRTSFADGLTEMWAWAQDAWYRYPVRRNPPTLHCEIERGLYPWWKSQQKELPNHAAVG